MLSPRMHVIDIKIRFILDTTYTNDMELKEGKKKHRKFLKNDIYVICIFFIIFLIIVII